MNKLLVRMVKLVIWVICLLFVVSACSLMTGSAQDAEPSPEPTSSIPNMHVISPQACQVAEQGMIQSESPQGDLIVWSPSSDNVAYIAAAQGSGWNIGELNILSAPRFDDPLRLAGNVAGELTWSPDAGSIAYLSLRRSDNLYTIGLAYTDGRLPVDLFPGEAARTDDYSSQKSILEWMETSRLRVLSSCGVDCMQTFDISIPGDLTSKVGDPIPRIPEMWAPQTNNLGAIPSVNADLKGQLNWSWDEKRIAYVDENGNAWVINSGEGTLYPLDIGQYGTVTETDWSYDSQYLAVQVDQYLKIFSFNCP